MFFVVLLGWMALNEEMARPFDTYPFIAALQAPVIMMSQNRHAAKDRSDAPTDYEVNVRAEMEIMSLHTKLDILRDQEWRRLVSLVERQQEALDRIQRHLDTANTGGEQQ